MTIATRTRHRYLLSPRHLAAVRESLAVALAPFVLARLLVLGALQLAQFLLTDLHVQSHAVTARVNAGLLGWDAAFYRDIAVRGYNALGHQSLRFFPLTPLMARVVGGLPGVGAGAALLIVTNAAALVAGAMAYRLTLNETGDEATARRAVWILMLAPPAFVLVMGYSEPLLLVTTIGSFMALRSRNWSSATLAGVLAGLTRPVGVLLVLPAAIEAGRGWGGATAGERARRAGAVAAPLAGCAAYLGWSWLTEGSFWLPLSEQLTPPHRGGIADPLATIGRDVGYLVHGTHIGSGLHVPWAIAFVALLVVAFLRLPSSYGWYAAATLAVAFSTSNLDSLERYGLGTFVFVLVAALLTRRERALWVVLAASAAGIVVYALLAFMNAYVP
jgi:Mannosyltransferase (PIG-V)